MLAPSCAAAHCLRWGRSVLANPRHLPRSVRAGCLGVLPYDVKICLAFADEPEFTPAFAAHAREELANRADIVFFATWKTAALPPNANVAGKLLSQWDRLTFDAIKAGDSSLVKGDKLYLLAVTRDDGDFLIRGREFDLQTRVMGPTNRRRCGALPGVPLACWDVVAASFVPLAKIESILPKSVTARVRAGGLITGPGISRAHSAGGFSATHYSPQRTNR